MTAPVKVPDPGNVVDLHIGTEEFRNNFQEIAASWATRPPFYVVADGVLQVYVCRYADIQEVFRAQDRFTVELPKTPDMSSFDLFNGVRVGFREDGEFHLRLRRLIAPLFGNKALADNFEPGIRATVSQMIDEIEARDDKRFDFMADFAENFIARILFDTMLEFEPAHIEAFVKMGKALEEVNNISPGGSYPTEYIEAFEASSKTVRDLIADRRANPRKDFISRLIQAQDEGQSLTDDDVFGTIFAICVSTLDTTSTASTLVLWTLLSHPGAWDQLRADPSLVRPAVEEALRFHNTSTSLFLRFAREDTELAGTKIPKGTRVVLISQAASYDTEQYDDPLTLDLQRDANHIAFGGGVHMCIGAPLAKKILQIVFASLLERMPNLRLQDPSFRPTYGPAVLAILKPVGLPVRFD
jgi:cytochrome P450